MRLVYFGLLVAVVACAVRRSVAISISNVNGVVMISGPDAGDYEIVQQNGGQIVRNRRTGEIASSFFSGGGAGGSIISTSSGGRGGGSVCSTSSSTIGGRGGGGGVATFSSAGGFPSAGVASNPAALMVANMMRGMGAGGAMAMALAR